MILKNLMISNFMTTVKKWSNELNHRHSEHEILQRQFSVQTKNITVASLAHTISDFHETLSVDTYKVHYCMTLPTITTHCWYRFTNNLIRNRVNNTFRNFYIYKSMRVPFFHEWKWSFLCCYWVCIKNCA